ncbi:MAG: immunoglobulin domain-containing protein [Bacteroidales bacterium]|nr:immunoglobulin domain-containing protein [Bacteroidales bacterium]
MLKNIIIIIMLLILINKFSYSQIGINTTGNLPDSSAALDVDFDNKGVLIPRLTTTQRNQIINPQNSLIIFNKTTKCFEVFLDSIWRNLWCKDCSTCFPCSTPPQNVNILCQPYPPCKNQPLTLMGVANSATNFNWTGPNNFTANSQYVIIPNFQNENEGIYSLTVTNSCGSQTTTLPIYIGTTTPENINVNVTPNPVCLGDTFLLQATGGQGATYWLWSGPNGFNAYSQNNFVTTTTESHHGVYTVTASNHCGQKSAQTNSLVVQDCPAKCMILGGPLDDLGNKIITTSDNGFLIVGQSNSFSNNNDIFIIKLNQNFLVQWKKTLGTILSDIGYAVIENSNKEFIIAGITNFNTAGIEDVLLLKIDSIGNLIWAKSVGGTNTEAYAGIVFNHIIKTNDNNYAYISVTQSYGSGLYDAYFIQFDDNGNILSSKAIGRGYYEYLYSFVQTSTNDFYFSGNAWILGSGQQDDIYLVKTDNSANLIWSKKINGPQREIGFKIITTTDNGFAVTGYTTSFGSGDRDIFLLKLTSSGTVDWIKSYGLNNIEEARDIVQTPDGGYAILGFTKSVGNGGEDILLIKTSSIGNLEWAKCIGKNNDERGVSMVIKNNEVVVLGNSNSYYNNYDIILAKFDLSGNSCCANCVSLNVANGSISESNITTNIINGGITKT